MASRRVRVAVEEEDRDGPGEKSFTQFLDFLQAAGGADLTQPRLGELPEVGQFGSELLPADVEDHSPGVLSLLVSTDESPFHFRPSRGNFQCFFKPVNVFLVGVIFILSENKIIEEVFLCIFTS